MIALKSVTFNAIPNSNNNIHNCYQKNNKNMRVIDSKTD